MGNYNKADSRIDVIISCVLVIVVRKGVALKSMWLLFIGPTATGGGWGDLPSHVLQGNVFVFFSHKSNKGLEKNIFARFLLKETEF